MLDLAIVSPHTMSPERVEEIAQAIVHAGEYAGTRAIGPGCIQCLRTLDEPAKHFGILVPEQSGLRAACDNRVVIYNLCAPCSRSASTGTISRHVLGAMLNMAQHVTARQARA